MNVFERIKNYGVVKLAKDIGTYQAKVSMWIKRKSIPRDYIDEISQILNIPVEEIIKNIKTAKNTQQKGSTHATNS